MSPLQELQGNYHRNPHVSQSRMDNQNAAMTPDSAVAPSPFQYPNSVSGFSLPDMSAVMFPTENSFVYPHQPMTTLENQQSIKQESMENMYNINDATTPHPSYGGSVLVPPYGLPHPSSDYSLHEAPMTSADPQNALAMSRQGWPTDPSQRRSGESAEDQLFGEDWGGWMSQGYRQ